MARVLLGVSGGIAAYKAVEFVRLATAAGHSVRVLMTASARRFIGADTFEGILGAPVLTSEFERDPMRGAFPGEPLPSHEPIGHLALAEGADVFLVAPASANTIAKLASGQADSILTAAFLATEAPRLLAPTMNERMYLATVTQANLDTLRDFGVDVIDPGEGRLASRGEEGVGRLPEPAELLERVDAALDRTAGTDDLAGLKILVTAGGCREPIDPVRFIGNRSSGRMGLAIARQAARRGADVTLIAANVALPFPSRVDSIRVETTAELSAACREHFPACDALYMAAAPADFTVDEPAADKLTRDEGAVELSLSATGDILAELSSGRKPNQTLIGFAAEYGGDAVGRAEGKLAKKGVDMIVLNDVSDPAIGFDSKQNAVTLVTAAGSRVLERASKDDIAGRILDRLSAAPGPATEPPSP